MPFGFRSKMLSDRCLDAVSDKAQRMVDEQCAVRVVGCLCILPDIEADTNHVAVHTTSFVVSRNPQRIESHLRLPQTLADNLVPRPPIRRPFPADTVAELAEALADLIETLSHVRINGKWAEAVVIEKGLSTHAFDVWHHFVTQVLFKVRELAG